MKGIECLRLDAASLMRTLWRTWGPLAPHVMLVNWRRGKALSVALPGRLKSA